MPIKTTVITGATSGIGKETALALAKAGHAVYMLVRDATKGEAVRQEIMTESNSRDVYVVECDLSDMRSVKAAAEVLKEKLFAINVLINNAGGIFNQRELSSDGFEMTFATNHLGHFLLTQCLLPLLERGQARVINVSSEAHKMGKPMFGDLLWEQGYSPMKAYNAAKLFNIYFTKSVAERYKSKGITAFALHPGVVNTSFGVGLGGFGKFLLMLARPFMKTPKQGAQTSIYLATTPKLDAKSGQYFKNEKVTKPSAIASDKAARDKLLDISVQLTAPFCK